MPTPAISVLVPICNVERYLRECLDSLQAQSFTDIEVICLNDGSTDASSSIAHEYEKLDERFKVVDKANSGYGDTMNQGLDLARGEYIAILESDDIMYPTALQTLYDLARTSGAQAVKGNFDFYWSVDNPRHELHSMVDETMEGSCIDTREDMRVYYFKPSIWSGLYRRDFLVDHDIRFLPTPGASYQDTSFAFKIWASCERACFTQDPIIYYRQDNEKSSVNSKGKVFCVCDEYQEIFSWLPTHVDEEHIGTLRTMAQISQLNAYLWNVDRLAEEFRLDFMMQMSQTFKGYRAAGELDLDAWDVWKRINVEAIMDRPKEYLKIRLKSHDNTRMGKAVFALRLGGPSALFAAIKGRH